MRRIFAADSKVMLFLSRFFDIVIVSLLFLVCCLPVITIGPALCALYSTTIKVVIRREGYVVRTFFRSFGSNFLPGFPSWLVLLAVGVLMAFNTYYTAVSFNNMAGMVLIAFYFALLCVVLVFCGYLFPMLSRYECSFKQLFVNSASLTFSHLKVSILLLLLQIAFVALIVLCWFYAAIFLFFIPVGYAVVQQFLLEKVFAAYA